MEFGWPIGMPCCRPLGEGLWETRSDVTGGRIARVLFTIVKGEMALLQGVVKKTRKTPVQELEVARKRLKEIT